MFENFDFMFIWPIVCVAEIITVVFSCLFMHYSAKYRNQNLSVGWYICGILFGIWTLFVFLIKRKDFPGPETKKCVQCERSFTETFEECPYCNVGLPVIDAEEKEKQKKLSKIFGAGIIISFVAAVVFLVLFCIAADYDLTNGLFTESRIAVNGVFYDKMGNSYEKGSDVLLYDEEGHVYTYTAFEVADENSFTYNEYYYVRDDGKKYSEFDCYVTQDGWFYCDKAGALEFYYVDTSTMTEEELNDYYEDMMEEETAEYWYYDNPYTDAAGNIYFAAYEASWNEKGELITAENNVYGN